MATSRRRSIFCRVPKGCLKNIPPTNRHYPNPLLDKSSRCLHTLKSSPTI